MSPSLEQALPSHSTHKYDVYYTTMSHLQNATLGVVTRRCSTRVPACNRASTSVQNRVRAVDVRHLGVLTKSPSPRTFSTCNDPSLFPDWQLGGEDGSHNGRSPTQIRADETTRHMPLAHGQWCAGDTGWRLSRLRLRRRDG